MNCSQCNAKMPASAQFCPECGAKTENQAAGCVSCGAPLKPDARFCHSCGEPAPPGKGSRARSVNSTGVAGSVQKNWLTTVGPFLFIPIFVAIIVLLFWQNENPGPKNNASTASAGTAGMSQADMGNVHATLERLKQNVETNPKDLVSIDSLAIMYAIAGNYEVSSQYYEQHLSIEPNNKDVKIALGLTYHNLKRTDEAIAQMKEVLVKDPTYSFALFYLGEIYASTGNKEDASKNWQLIVQHYPNTEVAKMAEQRIHELTHTE
ncbi:MAG: zinc-ribbon domain-containing protein [bacterium]